MSCGEWYRFRPYPSTSLKSKEIHALYSLLLKYFTIGIQKIIGLDEAEVYVFLYLQTIESGPE